MIYLKTMLVTMLALLWCSKWLHNAVVTLCLLANVLYIQRLVERLVFLVFGLRILATSLFFCSHGRIVGVSKKAEGKREKTFKAFRRYLMFYGFMQIEHDCSRTGEAVFLFLTAHYDSPRKAQCLAVILNE